MYFSIRSISGVFYLDINIISNNIVLNIFLYPKKVEITRYLLKYLLNFLIPTRAFCFIVDLKDLILGINRDIDPFLEGKESKIYFFK